MSGRMIEMLVPIAEAEKHEEGVAPRAGALENKVIGILDNTWEHYLPFAARIGELLSARYEAVRIVRRTKPDKTVSAPDDWVQEVATGCQVVINGVGAWGSCTTWSIHDSIQFEDRGIPTVTMVAKPFMPMARAAAKAHGRPLLHMVELPYAIINISAEGARELADKTFEQIVSALTGHKWNRRDNGLASYVPCVGVYIQMAGDHKLTSSRVEVEDSIEAAYELVYEKGWTDGLPIIPPTEARVHKMLAGIDKDPSEVIAEVSPAMGKATVEKIAVNAVMAGCLPAYLPVIIAAIEAMTQPEFNLNAIQCTNNPVAPLAIVNGPAVKELDINGSYNCLGQGRRSNATIGRAIRFVLLNIGGGIPGTVDLATAGRPGKYSFCLAENEDLNPWQPLHVERGFDKSVSTVTVVGVTSIVSVLPHSREPSDQLLMIAHSMALAGSNNFVLGGGAEVAAILSPTVASYAAQGGFSKEDVKRFLFENSKLPISYFAKEVQNNIIKDGRVADGMVDLVKGPEDIMVVVAGGEAGSHSVFAPTFGLTRAVTRPIRL